MDSKEEVNCILPLFDMRDKDLRPLLSHQLYQLLMTFNCVKNVDTLYEEAYLALLSNAFIYLINQQKPSTWQKGLIKLIYSTTIIVYGENKKFKEF